MGGDANGSVAEAGVEDVGAVSGRGHPGGDDRTGGGLPERAPADVLADLRAAEVTGGAHAPEWGFTPRSDVFEVVLEGHALGVRLGGPLESSVGRERPLALTGSCPVHQAEDGGADAGKVCPSGLQAGAAAIAGDATGSYVPLGEAMDGGPSRRSHDRKQGHGERYHEPLAWHNRTGLTRARAGVAGMARIVKQQQKRVA